MPARVRPHPFLEWEGPIAFAHRGGASDAPENTMPAFEYAVNLGYHYVETDIQVTADGVLVAFHDDDLRRTCGRAGKISQLPWSEVRTAMVDGEAPIPLLEDLFGAWPDLRVNIDCKTDRAVDPLAATLRRCNALDRVLVGSFDDRRTRRLRKVFGDRLATSLGPIGVGNLRYGWPLGMGSQAAQVPVRQGRFVIVGRRLIDRAHALGMQVHVWTIDDPAEMHRLLDLGVDGIMTDKPGVLRQVFEERGVWR